MNFLTQFLKYLRQFWHNVKNIADYAVIALIENRRIRILVNGDNNLGCLHSGKDSTC